MDISAIGFSPLDDAVALSLRQMGIQPTGNKELDRMIAEQENAINRLNSDDGKLKINTEESVVETTKSDTDNTDVNDLPWADVMYQLGLTPTGDEEEDYNTIIEEIDYQLENAQSEYDVSYYTWLRSDVDEIFSGYNPVTADNNFENMFIGATQLAYVNFTML